MNQDYPNIIETEETPLNPKNRLPVLIQLGILALIMFGLFGSLLTNQHESKTIAAVTESLETTNIKKDATILAQIPESDIQLVAKAAYVWDVAAQRVLFAKNESAQLPLASITKLMTALLAHELIDSNKMTTVSAQAIKQEGSSGLSVGEKLKIEELLGLALVSSSNDAAYELGASVGSLLGNNDPVNQFVQGMNIRADMLGLDTLEFWNTTGLDLNTTQPGSVGSARDVSFLMEYILRNYPAILEPTKEEAVRIYNTSGAYHDANNTNRVATEIPNLIGSKTGFTDLAGGNLTVAFDIGLNRPIIITVLGSTRDARFTDILSLVDAVQDSIKNN